MRDGAARRSAIWLLGLVLAGVAVWLVLNSPIFAVRSIRVFGNVTLTRTEILHLARVGEGDNLFQVSPRDIERAVRRSPWVAEATAERAWPSTLTLRITERRPVALAETRANTTVLLAADGTVLSRVPTTVAGRSLALGSSEAGYPYLPSARERLDPGEVYPRGAALTVAASFPPELRDVVARVRTEAAQITLTLREGGAVRYGVANATAAKNAGVLAVLERARTDGIQIGYIDVRIPSSPALKPAA
jgi:cell division protein FtsQ